MATTAPTTPIPKLCFPEAAAPVNGVYPGPALALALAVPYTAVVFAPVLSPPWATYTGVGVAAMAVFGESTAVEEDEVPVPPVIWNWGL